MAEFSGVGIKTTSDTFIPRPETGLLVEMALPLLNSRPGARVLDIGTGSGNIAIALTKRCPVCKIVALDVSRRALRVAAENACNNGVSGMIEFIESDLYEGLGERPPFDVIVSNPPYIPTWEIVTLAEHVKSEPRAALDGGEDGLSFYRRIIKGASSYLKKSGFLIMEMGYGQMWRIAPMLEEFTDIEIYKDFAGIDRVVKARLA